MNKQIFIVFGSITYENKDPLDSFTDFQAAETFRQSLVDYDQTRPVMSEDYSNLPDGTLYKEILAKEEWDKNHPAKCSHYDLYFIQPLNLNVAVRRRIDDGHLVACPKCASLDIGGARNAVSCYGCGLTIQRPGPLQNAINAWNMINGIQLDGIQPKSESYGSKLTDVAEELADIIEETSGIRPKKI